MNEDNIYEILGISIYCSYKQLMSAYVDYRKSVIKKQTQVDKIVRDMEEQNPWLKDARNQGEIMFNVQEQADMFSEYNRNINLSQGYISDRYKIDKLFKDNALNIYAIGKEQKEKYDNSHKTPNAILGISHIHNVELITAKDKADELIQMYPEHEEEIIQASNVVTEFEQRHEADIEQNVTKTEQEPIAMKRPENNSKYEVEEDLKSTNKKSGFRNWVKRIFAPALAVIGITVTVPKLLPEGENKEPANTPNPIEEMNPESFRDKIKVQGVIYDENGMQIVPDDEERPALFNNITSVPQVAEVKQDALAKFKTRMQGNANIERIVKNSLSNVKVNDSYDVSPYDKLDFIMSMIENKDKNCVTSYTQSTAGIKEYILNCINNVILYYVEQETGEDGLSLREEEQGVSIISSNGKRYIATTYSGIAKTNDDYIGTKKTLSSLERNTLNATKSLRNTYIKDYYTNTDSYIENLGSLLTNLNSIGDKQILASRDSQSAER